MNGSYRGDAGWRRTAIHRRSRQVAGVGTLALAMLGVGFVGTGEAAEVGCGAVITANTTLHSDIGPCPADGLVVTAGNIKLNLNHKHVFADNGAGDNAGVRLANVHKVTVSGGTVEGFDGGVVIMGGGGNAVRHVTAKNNMNDVGDPPCDLGDGIAIFDSNENTIMGNRALHNGPYSGISVVGDADRNLIRGNVASDNNIEAGGGCGINPLQDEGIRIEGPGANGNRVQFNRVSRNLLSGVGLHGYVCSDAGGDEVQPANSGTVVEGNIARDTAGTSIASGINFLEQGPAGIVCASFGNTVNNNTSTGNESEGIFVAYSSHDNVINRNVVNENGNMGIRLDDPAIGNQFTNVGPTLLDLVSPDQPAFVEDTDYAVLDGSGSGDVTAPLVPVGPITIPPAGFDTATSGCDPADFAGFPAGAVALVQRGFCARAQKVANALAAGASAVVMFNEGSPGRTGLLTAGVNPTTIPVVGTTYALGVQLYNLAQAGPVTIHVTTNTTNVPVVLARAPYDNILRDNRGHKNGAFDAYDGNVDPPCDNNKWQDSHFGTVNQPCISASSGLNKAKARTVAPGRAGHAVKGIGRNASSGQH